MPMQQRSFQTPDVSSLTEISCVKKCIQYVHYYSFYKVMEIRTLGNCDQLATNQDETLSTAGTGTYVWEVNVSDRHAYRCHNLF